MEETCDGSSNVACDTSGGDIWYEADPFIHVTQVTGVEDVRDWMACVPHLRISKSFMKVEESGYQIYQMRRPRDQQ